jgi:ATP-binding cassette, subfamily A (ABC1), member 3
VIWEVLLEQRAKRSIIFTTHFLDEVEVLADHLVILSKGKVKCKGAATELKNLHGGGYHVAVPKSSAGALEPPYPSTSHQDQIIYTVPNSTAAALLVSEFDKAGFSDVSTSSPQIEDVFLRVADEPELQNNDESKPYGPVNIVGLTPGTVISAFKQMQVLLLKRFVILKHLWWPYLYVLLLPIVITVVLAPFMDDYVAPNCNDQDMALAKPYANVLYSYGGNMYSSYPGSYTPPKLLIGGPPSTNESFYKILDARFSGAERFNMSYYDSNIVTRQSKEEFWQYIRENRKSIEPGVIFMGSDSQDIVFGNTYGYYSAIMLLNLINQMRGGVKIVANTQYMRSTSSQGGYNGAFWVVLFTLVQAIYPAAFSIYPAIEKQRKVRALQYANGIRRLPLWIAHGLFDLLFVLLLALAITIVIQMKYGAVWVGHAGIMFPILVLYGISAALMSYIMAVICKGPLSAFFLTVFVSLVQFAICAIALTVTNAYADINMVEQNVLGTTFGLNLLFPIGNLFRATTIGLNVSNVSCRDGGLVWAGSIFAYGGPILYLILQPLIFLAILVWLERGHSTKFGSKLVTSSSVGSTSEDEKAEMGARVSVSDEVENEMLRVESTDSDFLRLCHVSKTFGNTTAVDDVTLGLGEGEVMALIGPNGAGKSTIVNMIRRELRQDAGDIYLRDENNTSASSLRHLGGKLRPFLTRSCICL